MIRAELIATLAFIVSLFSLFISYVPHWEKVNSFIAMVFTRLKLWWYIIPIYWKKSFVAIYRISIQDSRTEFDPRFPFDQVFDPNFEILTDSTGRIKFNKIKSFIIRFEGCVIELEYKLKDCKDNEYNYIVETELNSNSEETSKKIIKIDELVIFNIKMIKANEKKLCNLPSREC